MFTLIFPISMQNRILAQTGRSTIYELCPICYEPVCVSILFCTETGNINVNIEHRLCNINGNKHTHIFLIY